MSKSKQANYKANSGTLDAPFFHFLLEPLLPCLGPVVQAVHRSRWHLSRPLMTPVLPKWFPAIPIPGLRFIPYLTIGELLLTLPLVGLFLAGYSMTFVSPALSGSGDVAGFAIILTFLTANKSNSIVAFLFGIPFERMIPYHNLSALTAVVLSLFHTYVAFVYGDESGDGSFEGGSRDRRLSSDNSQYAQFGANPDFVKFAFDGGTNTSGSLLVLALVSLVALSFFPIVRRLCFDFWLWTHVLLSICVIIFCLAHSVGTIVIAAFWWAIDVVVRYAVMAGCRYPHKASLRKLQDDLVEIRFAKPSGFDYNPGQFVQIAVPQLSVLEFHPISISSSPHEPEVTLHVRVLGRWSNRLAELAATKSEITIMLEGPYGSLSLDLDNQEKYSMVLCVSGGVGVTHCMSVGRSVLQEGRKLDKLRFVWAVRDLNMVRAMGRVLGDVAACRRATTTTCDPVEDIEAQVNTSASSDVENKEPSVETERMETTSEKQDLNGNTGSLQADVYVTRKSEPIEEDLVSGEWVVHKGRPDIDSILSELKQEAIDKKITHVAVFGCGPHGLIHTLRESCRQHSDCWFGGVKFDMHEEKFDF